MTEDMEKREEEERKECAYMKDLNDEDFLHEISWNNIYVFDRLNTIISKLSTIDTLKEENKEFREGDFNAALKNTLKKKTP